MTATREPVDERALIAKLLVELQRQPQTPFPASKENATDQMGVYLIRDAAGRVSHVGTTNRAGLRRRLRNHLQGKSSFTSRFLGRNGKRLIEDGFTFSYLVVEDQRQRSLLEHLAVGTLCPAHLGTYEPRRKR